MAIVDEKWGRAFGNQFAERAYLITEAEDEDIAHAAMLAEAPSTVDGLSRESSRVDEIEGAVDTYIGTVTYRLISGVQLEVNQSQFSFDTTGGTQHITQAKANRANWAPAGQTAPSFDGAIGVDEDGTIQGTDIVVPVYKWSEEWIKPDADITQAYKDAIYELTGKVNAATFRNRPAGEVLFMGGRGTRRNPAEWALHFSFAAQVNTTGITIGDITGITKFGWDYLWVRYKSEVRGDPPILAKVPASAHVDRVYDDGDFGALQI